MLNGSKYYECWAIGEGGAVKMIGPPKFTQVEALNMAEFRQTVVRGGNITLYVKYYGIYTKREDVGG